MLFAKFALAWMSIKRPSLPVSCKARWRRSQRLKFARGTTTREILALQDWLMERECREVAMESTGVLLIPL